MSELKGRKASAPRHSAPSVIHTVLIPLSIIIPSTTFCLAPLVVMLLLSLTPSGAWSEMALVLRGHATSDAYTFVWTQLKFSQLFLHSLLVALATAFLQTTSCSMTGYALARVRFQGGGTLLLILLATMMVPEAVLVLPMLEIANGRLLGEKPDADLMLYLNGGILVFLALTATVGVFLCASITGVPAVVKRLNPFLVTLLTALILVLVSWVALYVHPGFDAEWLNREAWGWNWTNTAKILVIPFIANPVTILLFRQVFCQTPDELWHAAQLDGDGHLRFFIRVAAPINASAFAVSALLSFTTSWNALLWPLLTQDMKLGLPTLNVGLASLEQEGGRQFNLEMAAATITTVPLLIVSIIGMKWLYRSFGYVGTR